MALAITEDHQALADVVREFAADHELRSQSRELLNETAPDPKSSGHSASSSAVPGAWKQMADLGWLGLHLPEEYGGAGYGLSELAVVLDELGYAAAPGPLLPTVVAAAVISERGDDALRARVLPGLADGSTVAAFGITGSLARDAQGKLSGDAGLVLGARWGQLLTLRVGDDVVVIGAADDGVTLTPIAGIDPSLGLAKVSLDGVDAPAAVTLTGAASFATTLFRSAVSAYAAGGSRGSLDMALEYAKVREQFGRIIGSFQAIKHHLANMLVNVELATALSWDAARAATDGGQGELAAAAAATLVPRFYQENAQKCIQLLGGIGFTWEHDAHLYLRRASALRGLLDSSGNAADDLFGLTSQQVRREYGVELPPEAESYRAEALAFLEKYRQTPAEERRALLVATGYLVPHWAKPYGRGARAVEQLVIEEELGEVELPSLGIGGWVLLTLTQTANPEQIERWIARSLAGELMWCQLFSEPNAGSDAAAVQTKGVRVEGGWQVSGQKVWTSGAQHCNRGLATIRTDPTAAKHKGITAMVIDLQAKGVEVRPLREITGNAMFNEVFFDDVFVPDADVVGEVNDGWRVARATLGNERVTIGGGSREGVSAEELVALSERYAAGDDELRREVARLVAEEQAMRLINLRQVSRAVAGSGPGPEGNVTKLLSAEHAQRVTELGMRIAGAAGITGEEEAISYEYLFDRCLSIAGGTSEITRNVIAERILGLPRDSLNR
ncbi:acyl-CoA dehydrogenase [Jatrophihabitans sp. DSM 45814]